jgi:CBS domain containing-hemolysin-like protein
LYLASKEVIADMRKRRLFGMLVLVLALSLSAPKPVYAYIDAGTTGSALAMLAPFIALFMVFLGFLTRPFRRFFRSILAMLRGKQEAEHFTDSEQSVSDCSPDDEKSMEDTGGAIEEPQSSRTRN